MRDRGDVVVYDWFARRLSYRARLRRDGIDVAVGFDLQPEGKLAVAFRPVELGRTGPTRVAWFSRSEPRAHLLPLRGRSTRIRIAGDRIALERHVTPTDRLGLRPGDGHAGGLPPPGQGRPCILRETGTTSVWLRPGLAAAPRRVARLSFDDQPLHQQE